LYLPILFFEREGKMIKRVMIIAFIALTLVTVTSAAAKSVTVRAITFLPKNDTRVLSFIDYLKIVEQKSNKTITPKFLGGAEVIPPLQQADNLKLGNVDIGMVPGGFFEGQVPGVSMAGLSQISVQEEIKRGLWTKFIEMCAPAGLYPVGRFMPQNDPLLYAGFKKGLSPASLKDLTGLKVGYAGPITKTWAQKLGMTFVQVPNAEFYTALDRGVVDALTLPMLNHLVYSMYNVESCIIDHAFSVSSGFLLMSLKFWNGLSEDQQKAVTDAYLEWVPKTIKIQRAETDKAKQTIIDKMGKNFFVKLPDSESEKYIQSFYDGEWEKWAKTKPELVKVLKPMMSK